jgi:predicted nucleic acid-binding protein
MLIVSDTSPLSNLFMIGKLDILEKLYDKIIIPGAVMDELLELEKRGIDLSPITFATWIEIVSIQKRESVNKLLDDLDLGEAEAIILAESLHADWLLIDETKGRNIARLHGLRIVGLLGILLLAKEKGVILHIKDLLDDLIKKAKFRVSDELYQKMILAAGE